MADAVVLWYLVGWPHDGGRPFHLAGPEVKEILESVAEGWVAHCEGWAKVTLVSSVPQQPFDAAQKQQTHPSSVTPL